MSATKPEIIATDIPAISPFVLEMLAEYAEKTGINLESASEQMFRLIPESLSQKQGYQLLEMLSDALAKQRAKRHMHHCVECGDTIACSRKACTVKEDMCHGCREGTALSQKQLYLQSQGNVVL